MGKGKRNRIERGEFSEKLKEKETELESKLKELDGRTGNLETVMSKTEEFQQAALKLRKSDPERPTQADPLLSSTAGQIGSQPESPPAKPKKSEDPRKLPKKYEICSVQGGRSAM
ncbi:uncharacterized protein LOC116021181 [Ipomoea triloba]|uniref:uncharacterized protein LOC116021181 n=1 Tax=Ipomoea triloba TaxID=35885 RepID=UPI00125D2595|nr:uncharacterized protein LOC116021181 [Ipomoea triloba]